MKAEPMAVSEITPDLDFILGTLRHGGVVAVDALTYEQLRDGAPWVMDSSGYAMLILPTGTITSQGYRVLIGKDIREYAVQVGHHASSALFVTKRVALALKQVDPELAFLSAGGDSPQYGVVRRPR